MARKVKITGNPRDLQRRVRRGLEQGMRALTEEVQRQIKLENPVDTGRSRAAWATRFNPAQLRGVVGNNVRYIRIVAEGGQIPAYTVRARRARALRFKPRGSTVFIYRRSARIPARTVPSTARERRNLGFHRRGAEKALKRAPELLLAALRQAGVPI